MDSDLFGLHVPAAERTPEQREIRSALAHELWKWRNFARRLVVGDKERNKKRDRSLANYHYYLSGLEATLSYISRLPNRTFVDVGAGTGRAFNSLSRMPKYRGIRFRGIDIMRSSDTVLEDYRITSAEVMRGFAPNSVGAFVSVYGPTHYTYIPPVFERLDELLIPDGLIKVAMTRFIPRSPLNVGWATRMKRMEHFFQTHHYDYAYCDAGYRGWGGEYRAYLAIKTRRGAQPKVRAADILAADRVATKKYARGYMPR